MSDQDDDQQLFAIQHPALRALLSDIDAEGLTASALQSSLTKLDVRKDELLMTLFAASSDTYSTHHYNNEDNDNEPPDLHSELACSSALAAIKDVLNSDDNNENSSTTSLTTLAAHDANLLHSLLDAHQKAAGVRLEAELQQRLGEIDSCISQGNFTDAAWIAIELEKSASTGETSLPEGAEATIKARVAPLRQYLAGILPAFVAIDAVTKLPSLKQPEEASKNGIKEALQAASVLGVSSEALNTLSDVLVQQCFLPIMRGEYGSGNSPKHAVEKVLYKALKLVCEQIVDNESENIGLLGEVLWPAVADAYIEMKLRAHEPTTDAQLDTFSKRGTLAQKIEQKAIKLGLIPSTASAPIARYVRNITARVLSSRRAKFVAAARDYMNSPAVHETVLLQSGSFQHHDVDTTNQQPVFSLINNQDDEKKDNIPGSISILAGVPPVIDPGPCCVSKAVQGITETMHEALKEAVSSGSPALAQAMCAAVLDMAAVIVALPPQSPQQSSTPTAAAGNEDDTMHREVNALLLPYPAALRYNDLYCIYTMLCTLPYEYSPGLQQLIGTDLNFLPAAERVKRAADDTLNAMIRTQEQELLSIAAEFQKLRGLDGPKMIKCKKAVMQLLHAFRRLSSVLKGVLAPRKLTEAAGRLAEAVCRYISDIILAMNDISVEEAEKIPSILSELTTGLHAMIITPLSTSAASSTTNPPASQEVLNRWCPSLERLVTLCWVLEARLKEIWERWESGKLTAAGLNNIQVSHLISALFEDTDLRRDVLKKLKGTKEERDAVGLGLGGQSLKKLIR